MKTQRYIYFTFKETTFCVDTKTGVVKCDNMPRFKDMTEKQTAGWWTLETRTAPKKGKFQ